MGESELLVHLRAITWLRVENKWREWGWGQDAQAKDNSPGPSIGGHSTLGVDRMEGCFQWKWKSLCNWLNVGVNTGKKFVFPWSPD